MLYYFHKCVDKVEILEDFSPVLPWEPKTVLTTSLIRSLKNRLRELLDIVMRRCVCVLSHSVMSNSLQPHVL